MRNKKTLNINEVIKENFDGFTIATPVKTHYEIAKYLIGHGKHVLVEKPITINVREAKELIILT